MSIADDIFDRNIKDILSSGYSTENEKVRPHWSDGAPAYTYKSFGIVNRYDLSKEFPDNSITDEAYSMFKESVNVSK